MLKKHAFLISLTILLVVISAGCSGQLSRSTAGSQISKHEKFPSTNTLTFYRGLATQIDADSDQGKLARALTSLGYMGEDGWLTEKAVKAKAQWKQKDIPIWPAGSDTQYEIPLGERELVEVTGLSEIEGPGGTYMQANFTWRWAATSDVGKEMEIGKNLQDGKALFQKFDDGWRVQNVKFAGDMGY
jgi:hypothetical protein